jgi:hypothetical protein
MTKPYETLILYNKTRQVTLAVIFPLYIIISVFRLLKSLILIIITLIIKRYIYIICLIILVRTLRNTSSLIKA